MDNKLLLYTLNVNPSTIFVRQGLKYMAFTGMEVIVQMKLAGTKGWAAEIREVWCLPNNSNAKSFIKII